MVREVHQPHAGGEETEVPPEDTGEDTVLLVQPPYDELYRHYVEAHNFLRIIKLNCTVP